VGELRYERVYFHPQRIAAMADVDRETALRALRELNRLGPFDYVAAFRGRAIHLLDGQRAFEELDIDFDELHRRRQAEYDKLERVIAYAKTRRCRQLEILRYFGDPERRTCGICDSCRRGKPLSTSVTDENASPAYEPAVLEAVRMVLSGVARTQGRFGKGLIAQMLYGSKAAKMSKFGLDQLSTFGLLKRVRQSDIEQLIESLIPCQLLEAVDVERNRPVLKLTELGGEVMRGTTGLPADFRLNPILAAQIAGTPLSTSRDQGESDDLPPLDALLQRALRDWRREKSDASGQPPYKLLTNASLELVARLKPKNKTELEDVKGIGPVTVRRYGKQILSIVAAHPSTTRRERSEAAPAPPRPATPPQSPAAPPSPSQEEPPHPPSLPPSAESEVGETFRQGDVKPDFYWTWRLLHEGYAANECEAIRRVSRSQILDHVAQAAETELPVRLEWLLSPDQINTLAEIVGDASPDRLRKVRDQLPPGIELRHVQLYLRTRW
jgi:ATP-dependent DNA helicase RecQ